NWACSIASGRRLTTSSPANSMPHRGRSPTSESRIAATAPRSSATEEEEEETAAAVTVTVGEGSTVVYRCRKTLALRTQAEQALALNGVRAPNGPSPVRATPAQPPAHARPRTLTVA